MSSTTKIVSLGHAGDGVTEDGRFVAYALPGETVTVRERGKHLAIGDVLSPSPDRIAPACRHFGTCGGCAMQHLSENAYRAWKQETIAATLAQRGLAAPVEAMRFVGPRTRRRAMFKARRTDTGVDLGFYEPESRNLVDMSECPVLVPALAAFMPRLRKALFSLLCVGETAEIHVTALAFGIDMALTWKRPRSTDTLAGLARLASALGLMRLSWNGEVVAQDTPPAMRIGAFDVKLPVAPFLQPTEEGERMLQDLVAENLGSARKVADLFCGIGTFALHVAQNRRIRAADSGAEMIAVLKAAARAHSNISAEARDLFRRPYAPEELTGLDAVILDPPRPGAKAQAEALARSRIPRLVYVSCAPASFARDAAVLAKGGYRLTRVSPVDQFLWSPHAELVGLFEWG